MDIKVLKYFVQVAKDQSYTRAAEHLFLSQPALSKLIKKLERELKVPLFRVQKNGVSLNLIRCRHLWRRCIRLRLAD